MSIHSGNIEQETEELLNAWQEAGSKGLDTWVELPAVYAAMTDGRGDDGGYGGQDDEWGDDLGDSRLLARRGGAKVITPA